MAKNLELSTGRKAAMGIAGVAQLTFAFLAFRDLARRDATEVRGRKKMWIPVILVNWIGPTSYFLFGIRR